MSGQLSNPAFRASQATVVEDQEDIRQAIEAEARRDEEHIERYGADDPEEPEQLTMVVPGEEEKDPYRVEWDGPDDPKNPQNWSKAYRTFASSLPSSMSRKLIAHFHFSAEVAYLLTSLFLVGYILGPMFWGPGSELFGRRPIFVGTLSLYTLFILGQALAHNTATLLITRLLSGFFAVAPLTMAGGVIADMFDAVGRGRSGTFFAASIFAVALRKETGNTKFYAEFERQGWSIRELLNRTLFRPFLMLFMEPILLLICIYMAVVYGVIYALFEAFPVIFMGLHGLTISQTGMMFIGIGVGTTLGAVFNLYLIKDYPVLIETWRGFPPPERRLPGAMIGGPLLVIGIFWLGWTGAYPAVPWYVPMMSSIPIGMSVALIFISFLTYLIDTYLMFAASAFAANTIVRSSVGAAFPLFTVQMFENMHVNWAATLIGCIGILLMPMPFLFSKYGPAIREKIEDADASNAGPENCEAA
ncbi:hypothetical protein EWM64_g8151 [Hericium alpestre]|uniref:Major facilitator superfamily (MFS) profile domain-containing protein n=1 Tax=Hericium alpestre TaxID=135208 RepID=A0A4Y9ZM52_9AGAM|nr:hypothetical protein EWM64_g8151 [Hericium alpestre]